MQRVLLPIFTAALLAGCQVQDPFAAFGPSRVPSPKTAQSAPYYPPTSTASKQPPAPPPATPRISVSAESNPPLAILSRFKADAADREPIRIVENPSATRTASAPSRTQTPGTTTSPSQPLAPPAGPARLPANGKPASPQSALPPKSASPTATSPSYRTDPAIAPATFYQPAPAFIESTPATGEWRTR